MRYITVFFLSLVLLIPIAIHSQGTAYTGTPPTVAVPVISPTSGAVTSPQTITMSVSTAGAAIHYAIGTTPTCASTLYSGGFSQSIPANVQAIGCLTGFANSGIASNTYTLSGGGTGTFSLVQIQSCTIATSATSCNATVSPALASGNLTVFGCHASNSAATPPTRISTVSAGGVLVPSDAASMGSWGSGATNDQQSYAYILPATATGGSSPIAIALDKATNFGTLCWLVELHPSANGSSVGIDNDSAFQPSAACTTCTDTNLTLTSTGTAIIRGFMGTSSNVYPTAVASPYATNATFATSGMSAGYSVAITGTGTGPAWTATSVTPILESLAFGWNPTAFVPQSFVDFESGTNGAAPTATTLASSTHGWQGGQWFVNNLATMLYSTAATIPLTNATGRFGDGTSYSAGAGSLGVSITSTGATQVDYITYQWGFNNPHPNMTMTYKYNDNLPATDMSLIDCGDIHGQTSDDAGVNCYGNGSTRYIRLETPEGNGSQINFSAPASCPCTIVVKYNAGTGTVAGTHSVLLYDSTSTLLGTSSHAGSTAVDYPISISVGEKAAQPITTGKVIKWDSIQLSLNSTVPNM